MKKDELILMLEEGLSLEEIPILNKLEEVEDLINQTGFDNEIEKKLKQITKHLKKETIEHSRIFSNLIKDAVKTR